MLLRRAGKDEAALTAFEEAATLDPESMRARVHLAAAHQALGHWLEADALLVELLQADDPYVERHRATLLLAQEFVGRHLGSLLIAGQPAGAVVKVDGRSLGTLPLTKALRLAVGSYQLEVTRPGYYPLQRPINVGAGSTLRESVALAPLAEAAPAAPERVAAVPSAAGAPRWLAWSLTGLAAGGAVATGVGWGVRNHHAAHWNSDACLQPGRLRGEVCAGERDDGKRAEQLAYVGGVATLVLAAGAVVSWTLREPLASDAPAAVALSCGLTLGFGACAGSF
ncbi:MAG: hypothetical protein RL033_4726 [Pseudomonadota bacterium]|jgi:tetratricopeptide (TPR) repeat protein